MTSVTVIIVAYNAGAFIQDCVSSLAAQSYGDFTAVIADNGSPDGSGVALNLPDQRFRIVDMGGNVGFAVANNRVARQVGSEFIALLNPDTRADVDWLANLVDAARAYPRAASIGSTQLNLTNPDILDGVGDVWHVAGLAWRAGAGLPRAAAPLDGEIFGPCAAGALYRREEFLTAGGFDERFFCYCEDVDLALRLRLAGWSSMRAAKAVVHHAGSGISGLQSEFSLFYGHRNRIWTFIKNTPGHWFWMLLPYHMLFNLIFLLGAKYSGILGPVWLGYKAAWSGRATFLGERKRRDDGRAYSKILYCLAKSPWSPWTRNLSV